MIKPFWRFGRWSAINVWFLIATAVLLIASTLLANVVLSGQVASKVTALPSQPSTGSTAGSGDGVTHDVENDVLPPSGKATVIFSGSGVRTSKPRALNYDWTGLWSVNCSDEPGISSLRIQLQEVNVASLGSPKTLVDKTFAVRGYQSGTFGGVSLASGTFTVTSRCDWVVTVIDTDLPSP